MLAGVHCLSNGPNIWFVGTKLTVVVADSQCYGCGSGGTDVLKRRRLNNAYNCCSNITKTIILITL